MIRSIDLEGAEKNVRTFSYSISNGETVAKVTSDNYKQPEGIFHIGFKPTTTKEKIAIAFVESNKLPTGGTFSFFEFGPGILKDNYARYDYPDVGGKQQSQYFSAEYIAFMYEQLGIAQDKLQKGLNLLAAGANLGGSGALMKAELKAAAGELKAAAGELRATTAERPNVIEQPLDKVGRRKAYAEKIFGEAGKSGNDLNNLMGTVDFSRSVKETVFNVGDKVYRFERFNAKGGSEMHFFTDAFGADAGPTSVGFSSPSGYKLVTYEITSPTKVMESTIRGKKTKQYFSTELQNNIKKIEEE